MVTGPVVGKGLFELFLILLTKQENSGVALGVASLNLHYSRLGLANVKEE